MVSSAGHVGEIIARFEKKGFKLVGLKMLVPPMSLLEEHYAEHKGKPFYPSLTGFMSSSAVVAMVWEGNNVVAIARKMMGPPSSGVCPRHHSWRLRLRYGTQRDPRIGLRRVC